MATFDLYQTVTDKIIASIEAGIMPWVKPWNNTKAFKSDFNLVSGKEYRGINTILLGMAGFNSPVWATYKQWQEKGCNVKKGQSGSMIVYASKVESKDASAITETNPEGKKEFFMMKYSTVFNAEQVEGYVPETKETKDFNTIDACETVLKPWAHKITHQGNQAFYSPLNDAITMPPKETFKTSAGYYSTAFHELSHLTGHESRLNRDFNNRFGTEAYAFEELIAELSSAFINHKCGLDSIQNHDAYIASWLHVLKNDKKAIFTASSQAQKAADMVLAGE